MNEVKPIKDAKKLAEIIEGLADYQTAHERRIYLLFMIGICTGLRIGDLIKLQAKHLNHGQKIVLEEEGTGRIQEIKINQTLRKVIDNELIGMGDNDFLFPSRQADRRGRVKPITVATAENDMKKIQHWFYLRFPFSCNSLRKTYGYWHYQKNRDLNMLAQQFHHYDISVTSKYIGLDEEDAENAVEKLFDWVPIDRKTPERKRSNQVNEPITTKHHDRTAQKKAYAERMKAGRLRKKIEKMEQQKMS